jgi:hypothetical protein
VRHSPVATATGWRRKTGHPEEKKTLVRFVGWGGLPQVFDAKNEQWAAEYRELQGILSPGDYLPPAVPPKMRITLRKPSSGPCIRDFPGWASVLGKS